MMIRLGRFCATVGVLALLTASCTSDPDEEATSSGSGTEETTEDGGSEQLEGSTRGITDDAIKVGYLGNNFGALAEAGIAPNLGDQSKTIPALVDEINENGGVGGRQIDLNLQVVDFAAGPQAAQAACLALTQDFGAAVVLVSPAVSRDTTRCITATNETLAIASTGWDDPLYEEADGRLFTVGSHTAMGTYRQYEAWGQLLHEEGALDGKTIGVVTSDASPEFVQAAENALLPKLEELGYDVAVNVVIPCPEGDNDCDQHEAAVQRMKDANVDFVFMAAANLAGATFVQAAKNLDFKPQWAANGNQVTDTVAKFFQGVHDWWDGAIGVSTVFGGDDDLSETSEECNAIVSERAGETYEPGSDAYSFTGVNCILFRVLELGMEAVEGDLNEATLIRAIESLEEVPMNAGPPGSISPEKHDAGDYVFLADFRADAGEFVRREGEPVKVED